MKAKFVYSIVLLALWQVLSGLGSSILRADNQFAEMLVFGDSFSDTGNMHLATGGALASSPYFDGRISNGPVFVEQAAMRLGLPTPAASLLGGTNYAFAGAPTGGDGFFDVPTLGEQIDIFLSEGNVLDGDELIVVQGGTNDALWYVLNGGLVGNDPPTAVGNIRNHILTLADAGGVAFVAPNILSASFPLIDLDPALAPLAPAFEEWVLVFNALLRDDIEDLEVELGVPILQLDQETFFSELRTSPRFGLMNGTEPGCPGCGIGFAAPDAENSIVDQPHRYVFWDLVHPSARAHQLLGTHFAVFVHRELNGLSHGD